MKNNAKVLLVSLVMVILSGLFFANAAYAKCCQVEAKCVNCLEHKQGCCKHCCCKQCKVCKQCCNKEEKPVLEQHDSCVKEKPAN